MSEICIKKKKDKTALNLGSTSKVYMVISMEFS